MRMIKEVAVKEDGRLITYYWFENRTKIRGTESRQQVTHNVTVSDCDCLTNGGVVKNMSECTKN